MHAIADTDRLVADGVITPEQADTIKARAREAMVVLGINSILCFGIIAATGGLIFWLGEPLSVAIYGSLALVLGLWILTKGTELFRMFGNASALIGAGMLAGGATVELVDKFPDIAGWAMLMVGAGVVLLSGWVVTRPASTVRFATGAILLMGLAMHLGGVVYLLMHHKMSGVSISLFYLYAAAVVAGSGWLVNVRLVTALAIVPFAQALDTGTFYIRAAYVFYSPEPTLSILQMSVLTAACLWAAGKFGERTARHARILAVIAFVVANLCALVGSLWGDVVGETLWGPGFFSYADDMNHDDWSASRDAFLKDALVLSENLYSVLWAVALAVIVLWAAHGNQRGLFNAALTFAGIHAYTQLFESFGDEPLAYVIGGLAAIPLAWGMWRLNHWILNRAENVVTH